MELAGGTLSRHLSRPWAGLIDTVHPTLVLDIGANYGEVSLGESLPRETELVLVEPNPALARCLQRTISEGARTLNTRCRVLSVAASDRTGQRSLSISDRSSGLSTLRAEGSTGRTQALQVEAVPLADIITVTSADRVLFKLDVEGHEMEALAGLQAALTRAATFAGIVELWPQHSHEDLAQLGRWFDVSLLRASGEECAASSHDLRRHLRGLPSGDTEFLRDVIVRPVGTELAQGLRR